MGTRTGSSTARTPASKPSRSASPSSLSRPACRRPSSPSPARSRCSADLIHNYGDALTAIPLGIAFFLRSFRGEKLAGLAVVLAIFVSACVALHETILRFIHPQQLTHLWVLAAAGAIGFLGNEVAARVRLRAGRRLTSPALIADGNHARIDGYVSLGVIASAIAVALGARLADPIIGLAITLVIIKITSDSWRTVSTTAEACLAAPPRPVQRMTPADHWLVALWPRVKAQLPSAPARVIEIGCGPHGGFVPLLDTSGYDATGIDPKAPEGLHYQRVEFENSELPTQVDTVIACTHQSWDAFRYTWAQREGLHSGETLLRLLDERFTRYSLSSGPYFFPDLADTSEADEQDAIDAGHIRATRIDYIGIRPS